MNKTRDRLLSLREVGLRLNCSPRTARRLKDDGHFRCCPVRGSIRVFESSLEAYIERQASLWASENGLAE